jgi:hypothetical protein
MSERDYGGHGQFGGYLQCEDCVVCLPENEASGVVSIYINIVLKEHKQR